jgi:hypothetical protein
MRSRLVEDAEVREEEWRALDFRDEWRRLEFYVEETDHVSS